MPTGFDRPEDFSYIASFVEEQPFEGRVREAINTGLQAQWRHWG